MSIPSYMTLSFLLCTERAGNRVEILIIAFSKKGYELAVKCRSRLKAELGTTALVAVSSSHLKPVQDEGILFAEGMEQIKEAVQRYFTGGNLIIFISSCGAAVRIIAPFIVSKDKDPAVLCMDETGGFCISLLSGHLGGANYFAKLVSKAVNAVPVITTASDIGNYFSPDTFAKLNKLQLSDLDMAKRISAASVSGMPIGIHIDEALNGLLVTYGGKNVRLIEGEEFHNSARIKEEYGIVVADCKSEDRFANTLYLAPKSLVLGIGCKRGTDAAAISHQVNECLDKNGLLLDAVYKVVSIDLKAEEQGLLDFAQSIGARLETFSGDMLKDIENKLSPDFFSASEFVASVTGVGCVCEESVVAAGAELIVKKCAGNGVTVAVGRAIV